MSIALVALIWLGLNYTPWGVRLEPVLYSVAVFIFITSDVAVVRLSLAGRRNLLTDDINIRFPGWEGGASIKP